MFRFTKQLAGVPRKLLTLLATSITGVLGCNLNPFPCPPGGTPAMSALSKAQRTAKLQAIAEELQTQLGFPGISIAIADVSSDVIVAAAGVRRIDADAATTPADRYHIGSVTKAVTATLIGVLVEEGTLDWNATLPALLPQLAETMHPDFQNVTLAQLLEFHAGLQPFTSGAEFDAVPELSGSPTEQRDMFAAWLLAQEPVASIGEYTYSNASIAITGLIAETATGKSWTELLAQKLLDPLGVAADSGWPASGDPNQPWGHFAENGGWTPSDPNGEYQFQPALQPAGDLNMTMADLALLFREHLLLLACREATIGVSRERVIELHTPPAKPAEETALGSWSLVDTGEQRGSVSTGSAGTFICVVVVEHGGEFVMTLAVNGAGANVEEIDRLSEALTLTAFTRAKQEGVIP